ncbi:zinc finger protein 888-like [Diaphorina citri]|uniref:Zinc finger protein 888-like n=1 Tax=Diaphorina citri TaxID=121845 RepID=A0A3Q0JKB3_DIACI|nr:zinc finger protein 888-like [Diaphorina citri]
MRKAFSNLLSGFMCVEVWPCCTCEAIFSSQSGLRSHIVTHAESNKELSEDLCSSCCTHLNSHSEERTNPGFTCYYCDELFAEISTLQLHMKITHPNQNNSYINPVLRWYTCRDCPNKLYRKTQGIIRHMRMWHDKYNIEPEHFAVKSLQDVMYSCSICSQRCYLAATCSLHRPPKEKSSSISNECDQHVQCHTCNECDSKHIDCQSLWDHVFSEHSNTFVRCNLCPPDRSAIKNKSTVIIRHMSQVHKKSIVLESNSPKDVEKKFWKEFKTKCKVLVRGKTVFRCPYCPKIVKTFGSLHCHLNIHTKDRKFVCEVCGAWFLHNSSLLAHKTTHSDTKFECEYCGRTYQHRNHLRRHIDQVHVNKWKSLCKICNKFFQDVRNHAAVHSTDRPFVCTLCGSSYKWKKHLVRHERICKVSNNG